MNCFILNNVLFNLYEIIMNVFTSSLYLVEYKIYVESRTYNPYFYITTI